MKSQIVDQSTRSLNRPISQVDYPFVSKDEILDQILNVNQN